MSLQEKTQKINYKNKILQIENCSAEDFIENLVDQITLKIKEECDCCNEANKASKEWLTIKEAYDYFKVSAPTLKLHRERGEVEYKKIGKSFRYLMV